MNTRNQFLSALEAGDQAALIPHLRAIHVQAGQVLLQEGAPVATVFFPADAVVALMTVLSDGRSVESATIGFETGVELLNAAAGAETTSRVLVQLAGDGHLLPAEVLRARMAESPTLVRQVMTHAQGSACRCGQTVACNALHSATERLAKWLLTTADRVGSDRFPITQDFLAGVMGVQRTTVTAVASGLKAKGLINYMRGRLEILDRPGLIREACECYMPSATVQAATVAA
ncbi:MAG: Crp/Fnr family transcriptional regulator [Pseudomonadota bacterium]